MLIFALRLTDCGSSPRNPRDRKTSGDYKTRGNQAEPEPLLSLITTSHPLLATTIEGAASAYNTGKNYSPHIKSSAEYVESCLKPVGKAVGNVGRKTGVEGGVRWIFGIRSRKQHSTTDIETGERGNSKRRKSDRNGKAQNVSGAARPDSDVESEDRRMSISTVDTLPAYDDSRSPAYTETAEDKGSPGPGPGAPGQQWGQRFVVTTSGLGVAMKEESLKSLKYCVRVVKDANGYISDVLVNLKNVIDEYDRGSQTNGEDHSMADGDHPSQHTAADRSRLIQRMGELRDDLFRVIHRTVQTVSKYAGSALPENARNLVHRQLMSLPGLYQFHYERESESRSETASPEAWARDSAHLALLFAKEALQMMTQVGDVLNRTLVSAEEWCDTLYRKKNEQSRSPLGMTESLPARQLVAADQDSNMSG
jgi:transcriptional repressor OPI1